MFAIQIQFIQLLLLGIWRLCHYNKFEKTKQLKVIESMDVYEIAQVEFINIYLDYF